MNSNSNISLILLLWLCSFPSWGLIAQDISQFNTDSFPYHFIDSSIIASRGLEERVAMLATDCTWNERVGERIDVFWMLSVKGSFFGYVYEYFMDCDNVRLIFWYRDNKGKGKIVDFMIEDLEDNSRFVTAERRYLKNKKKYKKYLED